MEESKVMSTKWLHMVFIGNPSAIVQRTHQSAVIGTQAHRYIDTVSRKQNHSEKS